MLGVSGKRVIDMWEEIESRLDLQEVPEYGLLQLLTEEPDKFWRRHEGNGPHRFRCLRNALFNPQGAFKACTGSASYPKGLGKNDRLIVAFSMAWLPSYEHGLLIRPGAEVPMATIAESQLLHRFRPASTLSGIAELSELFAAGVRRFGCRILESSSIGENV